MVMQEIKEDPEIRIKKWLEQLQTFRTPVPLGKLKVGGETDMQTQIRDAAYYLSLKNLPHKDLCWSLAEKIQLQNFSNPSIDNIRKTAEDISNSSKTYDELCWLIAEFEISNRK